ncbi:MAG: hypothetical protein HLUCCO02_11870 [Idiomarinaceae bacterium HL-53]|nr:MAG: hypothetical protein HLUCCO02_11870 [Idiomarinaceae bacterium HL-53]CUS49436.1 hypothetical protein Ga0003345_2430 [Idiomarinaceae bacterium HL-53]
MVSKNLKKFWLYWYRYWALKLHLNVTRECKRLAAIEHVKDAQHRLTAFISLFSAYDFLGNFESAHKSVAQHKKFPYGFYQHNETLARLNARHGKFNEVQKLWLYDAQNRDLAPRYNLEDIDTCSGQEKLATGL